MYRDLKCERIRFDECWSFVYAKQNSVTPDITEKNRRRSFPGRAQMVLE
jgi:hypothetical protein